MSIIGNELFLGLVFFSFFVFEKTFHEIKKGKSKDTYGEIN